MFDIGFWELTIIAIIALLVIGPDRLPEFARTTGLWIRKARQFLSGVRNDIDRELRTEDLKRILKEQEEFKAIHEIVEETKTTMADVTSEISLIDTPHDDGSVKSSSKKLDNNLPSENTKNFSLSHMSGDISDNTSDSALGDGLNTSTTNGKAPHA
uniref:Sec-independent protein translocase protein TatB n=1 Tax=Candidatus Kentrum sp. SD TaxID=2126332 RepID=A0A451BJE0_9GAMM|nr:MAG: sec-independent protein translocase protein TatB [Candidatus Kentron sp. SD]VFK49620.1 MAG: sec-independent protein translocase protein TatB [Candidatus Kentron sp. SD]VFK78420.1 MAG: sec-independent protein translocase protein TatB [Candidatus Kentron sp. SD]